MQHLRNLSVLGAILLSIQVFPAKAAEPIALHPQNPHYFVWRGEPTILVTSGEHYGALLNLDFDYVLFFDALKRDGLNHTRTFSGVYRKVPSSFGITDNPLAPKPTAYDLDSIRCIGLVEGLTSALQITRQCQI